MMIVLASTDYWLWASHCVKCFIFMILISKEPYEIGIIFLILEMKKLKFKESTHPYHSVLTHIVQLKSESTEFVLRSFWLQSQCAKPLSNSSSCCIHSHRKNPSAMPVSLMVSSFLCGKNVKNVTLQLVRFF